MCGRTEKEKKNEKQEKMIFHSGNAIELRPSDNE